MNTCDLVFTGFNRRVAALSKTTGRIVWEWTASHGRSYVTLLLDGDLLVAAVDGCMYGINARTGAQFWFNEMPGYGSGVTSLASRSGAIQNIAAAAAADAASAS